MKHIDVLRDVQPFYTREERRQHIKLNVVPIPRFMSAGWAASRSVGEPLVAIKADAEKTSASAPAAERGNVRERVNKSRKLGKRRDGHGEVKRESSKEHGPYVDPFRVGRRLPPSKGRDSAGLESVTKGFE